MAKPKGFNYEIVPNKKQKLRLKTIKLMRNVI